MCLGYYSRRDTKAETPNNNGNVSSVETQAQRMGIGNETGIENDAKVNCSVRSRDFGWWFVLLTFVRFCDGKGG